MTSTKKKREKRRKAKLRQRTFPYVRVRRGRAKLGRPRNPNSGVSHGARDEVDPKKPMHITLTWCDGLPSLRSPRVEQVLHGAMRAANASDGIRIVLFSIMGNHMHLICESPDKDTLARRMQGLKVRMAQGLNRLWDRVGQVFADRYHRVDLASPRQIRNCVAYVLLNLFRHSSSAQPGLDRYSSGRWFTGWRETAFRPCAADLATAPVLEPRTWLLREGWKRHGLISIGERPRAA